MDSQEIISEMHMSYCELCDYLVSKYGASEYDYFLTEDCISQNKKVKRGKEGLYCHHRDEDKGANLSGCQAQKQPFRWQKADRLVYCNLIEHLILHIKIAVMRHKTIVFRPFFHYFKFFTTGGVYEICYSINSLYANNGSTTYYLKKSYELIKENMTDYISILNATIHYIDSQYCGKRLPPTGIDIRDTYFSETDTAEEMFRKSDLSASLSSSDCIDIITNRLSTQRNGEIVTQIKEKIKIAHDDKEIKSLVDALSIDFRGHGFPQFSKILLSHEKYGSYTADEYISYAFPSHNPIPYSIDHLKPIFWKGNISLEVLDKHCFYIVRVKASFEIKSGCNPFVFDRKKLGLNIDDDNNFLYHHECLVSACEYPIELTLTEDDFILFLRQYTIHSLIYLDGCYFI